MIEVSVLVDKLNQMSANQIRSYFVDEKIYGEVGNDMECPIASWIRRESGRYVQVQESVWITEGMEPVYYELAEGPTEFVVYFDAERYPELQREVEYEYYS